jgi:predicted CoA-binding protein
MEQEFENPKDEIIKKILQDSKTTAVVGLSPDTSRPSFMVANYLKRCGYKIIPVNPKYPEILEEKSYPNLKDVPEKVDIVDIFRRAEDVMPIVEDAIKIKAKVVWMQEGITNLDAAKKATENGILVVMDRCMYKEHRKLL